MKTVLSKLGDVRRVTELDARLYVKAVSTKVTTKNSITVDTIVQAVWITYQFVWLVGMRIGWDNLRLKQEENLVNEYSSW